MASTPDIGKIVSMIMENPSLVSEIAGMVKSGTESNETEHAAVADDTGERESISAGVEPAEEPRRVHRIRLAAAMKPYLSKERAQAIDAMMSIADILEVARGK